MSRLEGAFCRLGDVLARRALLAATLCVLAAVAAGAALPRITVDISNESYFVSGDPELVRYRNFQETFGSDEVVYVLVETPDVFDAPHLERMVQLHQTLETLPHVLDVRSALASPFPVRRSDEIEMLTIADEPRDTAADRAYLRDLATSHEPFQAHLLGEQAKLAGFLVRFASPEGNPKMRGEIATALNKLLGEAPFASYRAAAVGTPINTTAFARILADQALVFFLTGMLITTVLLLLLLRSPAATAASLLVVAATIVVTFGSMALTETPLSTMSGILITLMICVGVADAVHVAVAYRTHLLESEPREAYAKALAEVGPPCLFTSLTTAAGFLALLTSQIAPVRHLGLFGAIGCVVAFLCTISIMPLLLTRIQVGAKARHPDLWDARLRSLASAIARRPLVCALAVLLPVIVLASRAGTDVNHDFLNYLSPEEKLRLDIEFVDDRMGGAVGGEIVIDSGEPNGLINAELWRAIAGLQSWLETEIEPLRSTRSSADALAELHRLLAPNSASHLPQSDEEVAQLLLLYEMLDRDSLFRSVDSERRRARIALRMLLTGSRVYAQLLERLDVELERRFPDTDAQLTGGAVMLARMKDYILSTQLRSFGLALVVISVLLLLLARNLRLGFSAILTNALPIAGALGVMGWLSMPLDVSNVLVATVAIGIAVDDTIHFLYRYRENATSGLRPVAAAQATLATAGRALLFTTLTLVLTFSAYLFSSLQNIRDFGVLAATAFALAFLCDVVLLPALLLIGQSRTGPASVSGSRNT